jgi:hypothetical protein
MNILPGAANLARGILVISMVPSMALPGVAHAQAGRPPTEVEVTNTPDVNVVNTPNVNVANTPSVEVTNSPTVELAPGAAVRDRDNPALQPVQFSCEITLLDLDQIDSTSCGTLPSGKRLIIEYISAEAFVPTGQRPIMRVNVTNMDPFTTALSSIEYHFYFQDCGPVAPSSNCYNLSELVRLYHTQVGFNVVLTFNRTGPFTGGASLTANFSGYLVDVP